MKGFVRLLWTSFCFTPLWIPAAIAQTEIPLLPKPDAVPEYHPSVGSSLQAQTADSPPPVTQDLTTLQIKPRWGIGYSTSGAGYDGFTRLDSFLPLWQTPGSTLTFLEGQLQLDNSANLGGNLLLGHRFYHQSLNRIFGGYLGFDSRNTGNNTFHQLGVGLETLGAVWDVRLNGYFPLGDSRDLVDETVFDTGFQLTERFFEDHFLVVQGQRQRGQVRQFEAAMTGFDLEVGARLAKWGQGGGLRGYGGLYYYDATGSDSSLGWRMRLEVQPTDTLNFGVAVQDDQIFGTNVIVSVGAIFGKTRSQADAGILSRLGDGVGRNSSITVDSQTESDFSSEEIITTATNPQTGEPYVFQHVNLGANGGNGTVETPFDTLDSALAATRSQGNDIVYVQEGTNPGIPAFTIPDQVQVLSTGPIQQLDTVEFGSVQLPLSGAGVLPQVTDTVMLGNNTVLSGFAITGVTNPGIVARNISNGEVRDSIINSSSQAGVLLENTGGSISFTNSTIAGNGVPSLIVTSVNDVAIANSTLTSTNSATQGISLDTVSGIFDISDSTITIANPSSNGILATNIQGSARISANTGSQITTEGNQAGISLTESTGAINLSGVTVESIGGRVVEVSNINNGAIANTTLTSTNSATQGISLDTVSGIFDISDSTITITNPTDNGIAATNIQGTATISANQGSQITTTTTNAGILLAESPGTINLTGLEVNSTNGAALVGTTLNNATISDSTLTSINSSTNGISLNGISGTVDISNSTITITDPVDNINGISVGNITGTVNIAANAGSQITQANRGIELLESTGAIAISGFEIRNTDDSGISGINLGNVTLANNRIEGATNEGIYLADTDGEVTISQNTIINIIGVEDPDPTNPLDFPTGQGILLNNVTGSVEVSLNTISGTIGFKPEFPIPSSGQGIVINNDTGSVNITIFNNQIFNNYEDAILFGFGLSFPGNPIVNLTIEGNTIENNGGSNPTRGDGIGIGLEGSAILENLTISGNTIRNNGDEGIDIRLGSLNLPLFVNSTAQIQEAIIQNNTIENNAQQGINLELSDNTAVFTNILSNILMNFSTDVIVKRNDNSEICLYLSENSNNYTFTLNGITPNNSPCF
ncbi:MAG: right-handed parallel beta-helix repeat-containing protein [Coleofasciculus sp. G1-WW12-02]|uniref:right-handed parallel beta-helix repeat-containing protein n=1 Tax=Coleofasciculus sp. G1-WW12-02 TaxID=3068483 RepID=UPI0033021BB8